ncbi:MAG: transposase, partial [Planctomycetota bacterium]
MVVIGVTEDRRRQILALQAGDKESKRAWEAMFADLLRRCLDPATIQLGIMDGLPGLERAFLATFRKATVQRCQVHKAKNVLAKVRKKDRKVVVFTRKLDTAPRPWGSSCSTHSPELSAHTRANVVSYVLRQPCCCKADKGAGKCCRRANLLCWLSLLLFWPSPFVGPRLPTPGLRTPSCWSTVPA